MLFNR